MNPNNDYQTPPSSDQPADSSTEAWFNGIDSPPSAYKPPEQTSSSSKLWKIIGLLVTGLVVLGVAGFILAQFLGDQSPGTLQGRCLNNADYLEFVGEKTDDPVSSRDVFYAESIAFTPGSSSFADDTAAKTHEFIEKISTFYKKRSDEASIKIIIGSDYLASQSADLAKSRITTLEQALLDAAIPEAAISSNEPKVLSIETDSLQEDAPTIVSIMSDSRCKE